LLLALHHSLCGFFTGHIADERMRMEKTRQLLRETTKSVIEVGLDVGCSNPSHFAQIFRREVGVAPREYRGQF
jgi:AraC family transcriptional regulator